MSYLFLSCTEKFKIEPDAEFQGSIQKAPNGQVYLWCDNSM